VSIPSVSCTRHLEAPCLTRSVSIAELPSLSIAPSRLKIADDPGLDAAITTLAQSRHAPGEFSRAAGACSVGCGLQRRTPGLRRQEAPALTDDTHAPRATRVLDQDRLAIAGTTKAIRQFTGRPDFGL
jgi:hypothetical protein